MFGVASTLIRVVDGVPCSFGGAWDYGKGPAEAEMDEDEYAQRVWERMEQKRRASNGASAAAREQWGKADSAAARRQVRTLPAFSCVASPRTSKRPLHDFLHFYQNVG